MQTGKKRNESKNKKKKQHAEERLDEAIRLTFPASDPTAAGEATSTEPAGRPTDRRSMAISRQDIEQAREGKGHIQNDSIKRSS